MAQHALKANYRTHTRIHTRIHTRNTRTRKHKNMQAKIYNIPLSGGFGPTFLGIRSHETIDLSKAVKMSKTVRRKQVSCLLLAHIAFSRWVARGRYEVLLFQALLHSGFLEKQMPGIHSRLTFLCLLLFVPCLCRGAFRSIG